MAGRARAAALRGAIACSAILLHSSVKPCLTYFIARLRPMPYVIACSAAERACKKGDRRQPHSGCHTP
eukprot:4913268-Alexandrium_andersonii.AAC.1